MGSEMCIRDSLGSILKLIPGMGQIGDLAPAEKEMKKVEAIIQSMTQEERKKPDILKASRKQRIAAGSGTQVSDVNRLLKQFDQMKSMMKMFSGGKMPSFPSFPGGFKGGKGKFPF